MAKPLKIEDDQGYAPTRETARKRRYDTLGYLYKRRLIGYSDLRAADSIRRAVELITADVRYHPPSYEDQGRIPRKSGPRPTGYSSPMECELQLNYCNWIDALTKRKIRAGPVMDIIVDGLGIRVVEHKWRIHRGDLLPYLGECLGIYTRLETRLAELV